MDVITFIPKCSMHVPAEFIPEAIEFEDNMNKLGIVKSTLFEARMASYEAEWGPEKPISPPELVYEGPSVSQNSTFLKVMIGGGDLSQYSNESYDCVDYAFHQPLSSLIDDEEGDLLQIVPSPFNFNTESASESVLANARTGLSTVLDDLCVSPNGGKSKKNTKCPRKERKESYKARSSTRADCAVSVKKSSSKKRKESFDLRRD